MSQNHLKPIKSAEAVAALRAASNKEKNRAFANPDYLAADFVGGLYALIIALPHWLARRLIEWITPGSYCFFLARTRFIDEHFQQALKNNIQQFVLLGAGYDSRANRFQTQLANSKIYELDLPATQQHKLAKMRQKSIPICANTIYIPCDFNTGSLKTVLQQSGFDFNKPAFFIWEGVSYYLHENAVKEVFNFIAKDCAKHSTIVFDYALQSFVEGNTNTYGGKKIQKWLKKNNEHLYFGLNEGDLAAYLQTLGLKVQEDIGPTEMRSRYLNPPNSPPLGQPLGHLRLAYASSV